MNLITGIIVAVIGLLIALLGALKVVPGQTSTGVCLILLGGLVIGLSFIAKPEAEDAPRKSTVETLLGVFYAPAEIFQNLRRHPRWLVAALIMSLLSSIYINAFIYRLTPERVANFTIDKTLEMSFLGDDAKKQIETTRPQAIEDLKNPVNIAGQAVRSFVGLVFGYTFLGAVFFLFGLAMGGKLNFWQAFSSAIYAGFALSVIKFVLNMLLLFVKDPADIHPIIGQNSLIQDNLNFLVLSSEHPVIYSFLGAFSLLTFYWIWLNSTGLENAGDRVTKSTAWTATISIWVLGILLGVGLATVFPSFIS